jgi:probable O-glycosylation ligase (exosortase A-associated)
VSLRGILLLSVLLPCLPVCFFRPFFGILLWTIVAFVSPQWYTWSGWEFPYAMAIAIPTLAGFVTFARGWSYRLFSRELVLLIVLWVWFTITSIVSSNTSLFVHHSADTWFRWDVVSKILLMTVVTVAIVDRFGRLRTLVLVIASCFGLFVVKAFPFMILTGGEYRIYGPPHSMIEDNNDFGLALNMTLPMFFFLAQTETRPWVKKLFWFLFLITIPAIFFTYSRGAVVGLLAIGLVMFLQLKQRLALVPVIALTVCIVILFAPESWRQRMDPTREGAIDASALSRINAWTYSWRLAVNSPITGGGFDTFTPELFNRYAPNPKDVHGPHSVYFGVLAEHGFVGLFLYLGLLAASFLRLHRIIKRARSYGDQIAVSYANMFRLSLIGFVVTGTFLGRAYFDYFFTILACLLALNRLCESDWAQSTEIDAPEEVALNEAVS